MGGGAEPEIRKAARLRLEPYLLPPGLPSRMAVARPIPEPRDLGPSPACTLPPSRRSTGLGGCRSRAGGGVAIPPTALTGTLLTLSQPRLR